MTEFIGESTPTDDRAGWAVMPRWMLHDRTIPADAKWVWLILSSMIGEKRVCWPSHKTIAADLDCSVSTVQRSLRWLRDNGLVDWEQRKRPDDGQTSNAYWLILDGREGPGPSDRPPRSDRPTPPVTLTDPLGLGDRQKEPQVKEPQGKNEEPSSRPAAPSAPEQGPREANSNKAGTEGDGPSVDEPGYNQGADRLCDYLADKVASLDPDGKRPNVTKTWRKDMRLLLEADGREEAKVYTAIDWAFADDWYRARVLAPKALRRLYTEMQIRAANPQRRGRPTAQERQQTNLQLVRELEEQERNNSRGAIG